jgi:hypothetical protein
MIVDVVNEYGERAGRFDDWLVKEIGKKYQSEIADFYEAAKTHESEVRRVFGS